MNHVRTSHEAVLDLGVVPSSTLPERDADIINFPAYENGAPKSLQHMLTVQWHRMALKNLETDRALPPSDRARILSASALYSSMWLDALPVDNDRRLTLSDAEMSWAVRMLLGLELPHAVRCPCAVYTRDPLHFQTCPKNKRTVLTHRHDHVLRTLAGLAREAGLACMLEPLTRETRAEHGLRPDGLLITPQGDNLWFDVTICTPSSATALAAGSASHRGREAHRASLRKHSKYRAHVQTHGGTFAGCAMEAHGALHSDVLRVLRVFADAAVSQGWSQQRFLTRALFRVAIALQQGNAWTFLRLVGRDASAPGSA